MVYYSFSSVQIELAIGVREKFTFLSLLWDSELCMTVDTRSDWNRWNVIECKCGAGARCSCKNFVRRECKQCTSSDSSVLFFGPSRSRAHPTAAARFSCPFFFRLHVEFCTREYRSPYANPRELRPLSPARSFRLFAACAYVSLLSVPAA